MIISKHTADCCLSFNVGEKFLKPLFTEISNFMTNKDDASFINNIPMSRNTTVNNIEKISNGLLENLVETMNKVKYISLALDESLDISDTAELLVFVRYVSFDFGIEEKLLTLIPMKDRTQGIDIYRAVIAKIEEFGLNTNKIISISTDFCSLFAKEFCPIFFSIIASTSIQH
ncbi:hypothetical protein SNEBB_007960 [Seison nebaliae]|nr:hypothetical protein SNEBB_007960 [Seison nebaliae]